MRIRPGILVVILTLTSCDKAAEPPAAPAPIPQPPRLRTEPVPQPAPSDKPAELEPENRIASGPHAPPPAPPPKPSEAEIMDKLASEKFDAAKQAYERQELFDAIEQAEEARRILSALASLFESQGQSGRVKDVNQRIRNITEFIVLCRKTPGSKFESKPPSSQPTPQTPSQSAPPSAPPPVAPRDSKEFEAFYDVFIAFLKGHRADRPVKADDLVLRARLLARKETGTELSFIQAVVLIVTALQRQEWPASPEEAGLLNAYAGRFPKPGNHVDAFNFLIEGLIRFEPQSPRLRLPAARTLALLHLDALRAQISVDPILVKHRAILELTDQFFTAESEAVEAIRAAQGKDEAQSFLELVQTFDGIREPLYRTHRLKQLFLATTTYKSDQALAILPVVLAEAGRPAPYPSFKPLQDEWKAILASFKPCKWCSGSHRVNCDYRCQEGKVTKMCMVCSGTGKKPGYGDTRPCPERYDHPHTWTEDCPRCKGTGGLPCRSCKAAWQEPSEEKIVVRKRCELCAGAGFLTSFHLICPDCHAIGSILTPSKKK